MLSSKAWCGKPCFHLAIVWLRNGFWSLLTQRLLRGGRCSMNDESDKDMCFSFYSVPKCYVCGLNHCVFVRRPSICCDPKGNVWFISFCRFCLFQYFLVAVDLQHLLTFYRICRSIWMHSTYWWFKHKGNIFIWEAAYGEKCKGISLSYIFRCWLSFSHVPMWRTSLEGLKWLDTGVKDCLSSPAPCSSAHLRLD